MTELIPLVGAATLKNETECSGRLKISRSAVRFDNDLQTAAFRYLLAGGAIGGKTGSFARGL
jgi:hypothetical protein